MPPTARLSADQVRLAMRAVGECRDVGHDPAAWSLRISSFLREHLRSVFTVSFTATVADAESTVRHILFTHWADNRFHRRWQKFTVGTTYRRFPSVRRFSELYVGEPLTVTRQDLVPGRAWATSAERDDRRAVLQDELVISAEPYRDGLAHVFSINRADGDVPFSARDKALVRLVHGELGRLFGGRLSLTPRTNAPPADLPPRLHAVLICLLSGESDKEIAGRFGLSPHTVHEYVTTLYRRFTVRSRAELFSLAERNGWARAVHPPE